MTIKDIITDGKLQQAVPIKKCSAVNIGFVNKKGQDDETQLDIHSNPLLNDGMQELSDLFASLADELETATDSVTYVEDVASAGNMERLESLGY